MSFTNCTCRVSCTLLGLIAGIILGIITAFAQITGVLTVTTGFLWASLGIAVVALWTLVLATALVRRSGILPSCYAAVSGLIAGILGTILLAVILLAVGITATSIISAILVGLLVFFLTLVFADAACFVRCLTSCDDA